MKIQSRLVLISIVLSLYAPSLVLADELVQGVREDVIKKLEKKQC
jgi:hypothetical protein